MAVLFWGVSLIMKAALRRALRISGALSRPAKRTTL